MPISIECYLNYNFLLYPSGISKALKRVMHQSEVFNAVARVAYSSLSRDPLRAMADIWAWLEAAAVSAHKGSDWKSLRHLLNVLLYVCHPINDDERRTAVMQELRNLFVAAARPVEGRHGLNDWKNLMQAIDAVGEYLNIWRYHVLVPCI